MIFISKIKYIHIYNHRYCWTDWTITNLPLSCYQSGCVVIFSSFLSTGNLIDYTKLTKLECSAILLIVQLGQSWTLTTPPSVTFYHFQATWRFGSWYMLWIVGMWCLLLDQSSSSFRESEKPECFNSLCMMHYSFSYY